MPKHVGKEMRSSRLSRALEMEDYAVAIALDRARRETIAHSAQHPAIMHLQPEGQSLPVSFAGAVVPHEPLVVPPEVIPIFPPQALETRLEEGERVGAPARRDMLGDDGRSDMLWLQELWDMQEWGSQQDAILRMGAPSFVPGSQRPVNFIA